MSERVVNDEAEKIQKEAGWKTCEVIFGRDFNIGPTEYETGVLTAHPQR
jgi:hypothetical protein